RVAAPSDGPGRGRPIRQHRHRPQLQLRLLIASRISQSGRRYPYSERLDGVYDKDEISKNSHQNSQGGSTMTIGHRLTLIIALAFACASGSLQAQTVVRMEIHPIETVTLKTQQFLTGD